MRCTRPGCWRWDGETVHLPLSVWALLGLPWEAEVLVLHSADTPRRPPSFDPRILDHEPINSARWRMHWWTT